MGWVVRPVDRDEHLPPKRYESGLVLSVEGAFHQLDNQARGYGTRDFPVWEHTVAPEPVAMPVEARLIAELGAVLAANGLERSVVRYRPVGDGADPRVHRAHATSDGGPTTRTPCSPARGWRRSPTASAARRRARSRAGR